MCYFTDCICGAEVFVDRLLVLVQKNNNNHNVYHLHQIMK